MIRPNFSQNVLTAARELQQVNQNIQSLENQATMLINQAKNLASLPYSSLAQLEASIQRTEQLLMQAQNIAYSVTTIDQAFTQVYPQSYSGSTSSTQMLADAQTRWQNARAGYQDSMHVQAGVVQNLQNAQTQISALVSSSQSASGALQATQSGNQIMGLAAQQLADLTRRHRCDGAGAKPRQCRPAGKRGAGPAADAEFPELRRRLSAWQRADVPLMRGPLLNLPAIGRAAGCLLAAAAIIAAAVRFHRHGAPRPLPTSSAASRADPLAAAMARCQALGMAAENDVGCQATWAGKPPPFLQ